MLCSESSRNFSCECPVRDTPVTSLWYLVKVWREEQSLAFCFRKHRTGHLSSRVK